MKLFKKIFKKRPPRPFYPIWYEKMWDMLMSNVITGILTIIIFLWIIITSVWYITADIRHVVYQTPPHPLKNIITAQKKMLTLQDAKIVDPKVNIKNK